MVIIINLLLSFFVQTGSSSTSLDNVDTYMIYANYTGEYVDVYDDDDYKLDYFMEDIGLNTMYYYMRKVMPFWLSNKDFDIPKEASNYFYYYWHQQLVARYYLERISNDLGEIEEYDWNRKFSPGYYSTLMYSNGIAMPQRSRYSNTPYYKYKYLKVSFIHCPLCLNVQLYFLFIDRDGLFRRSRLWRCVS